MKPLHFKGVFACKDFEKIDITQMKEEKPWNRILQATSVRIEIRCLALGYLLPQEETSFIECYIIQIVI